MNKCFYCDRVVEDKKYFHEHEMYQIISINKLMPGYKYNTRNISIPRCKSCYSKHTSFWLTFFLPLFIMTLSVVFYLFYTNPNNDKSELWEWVGIFFICCIISSFIAGLIAKFLEFLFFKKIYNIPKEEDIREYGPIKELLLRNWQFHKKDPSVASIEHIAKDSPNYKESD